MRHRSHRPLLFPIQNVKKGPFEEIWGSYGMPHGPSDSSPPLVIKNLIFMYVYVCSRLNIFSAIWLNPNKFFHIPIINEESQRKNQARWENSHFRKNRFKFFCRQPSKILLSQLLAKINFQNWKTKKITAEFKFRFKYVHHVNFSYAWCIH
jgi:hypothetical protein